MIKTETLHNNTEKPCTERSRSELVPQLRFAEFNDEWEIKQLGKLGKIVTGLTYSPKDIVDNGILVLRSSNIQDGYLSFDDNVYVDVEKFNPVEENDILICVRNGSRRLIGKNTIIDKDNVGHAFGAFMTVFRGQNNQFLYYYFDTEDYKKEIHKNLGATINSINGNDLKKFKVGFPTLPEQQKIAGFLTAVDTKIRQLTQKKELLVQYKKGVMRQLFSQELRFKQDDGSDYPDWVKSKIGDSCNVAMCKRIFADQTSEIGDVPFYKIGTIGKSPDAFISIELFKEYKDKYKFPRKGEILITCSGTVGKCIPYDGQKAYYQDSNIVWLDNPDLEISNEFLYYVLSEFNWGKLNSTTITRIYSSDLKSLKIEHPVSQEEQQKIASYLSAIDTKIEKVAEQIEQTQEFKKGLLQQMFV